MLCEEEFCSSRAPCAQNYSYLKRYLIKIIINFNQIQEIILINIKDYERFS